MKNRFFPHLPVAVIAIVLISVVLFTVGLFTTGLSILSSQFSQDHSPAAINAEGVQAGSVADVQTTALSQPNQNDDPPKDPLADAAWRSWDALPLADKRKVDPHILAELRGDVIPTHLGGVASESEIAPSFQQALDKTRFIVYLRAQPDLSSLANQVHASQVSQRSAVFNELVATAQESQAAVKNRLDAQLTQGNVSGYQTFHIVNAIAVEGGLATIVELALRPDVERIAANYPLIPLWTSGNASAAHNSQFATPDDTTDVNTLSSDNWNIDLVDADRVWQELRVTGEGAVVAGFDTGVEYRHPALRKKYRGSLSDGSFDHNYSWFEPDNKLYADGNLGSSVSDEPYDCSGHGTHTMGTMVGDGDSEGKQIGMAPGAQWIALPGICGNTMSGGLGDDIGGLKAFQWVLCPTDLSGDLSTADCSKAPDVVNNSWGSANPTNDVFRPAIQALRTAGVAPVFAAGNPSAGEGSIGAPANAPEAITVGATDSDDEIASFSGRGPSFYEGEQKPELSAPGVEVLSSIGNNDYIPASGTSMAAPHVAGLIALMVSADLQDGIRDFNVDELERFMIDTALDLGKPGVDNDYGHGRIDAYNAVRWVLSAGDLRGYVRDAESGAPIMGAKATGLSGGQSQPFSTHTGATGLYSITVPSGRYNISIEAWGYEDATFASQTVVEGALSAADFVLTPLPTVVLNGFVRSGNANSGAAVSGALVYIVENPTVSTQTDASGAYSLTVPAGAHEIAVAANGYRNTSASVDGSNRGAVSYNFALTEAPSILLVDGDAHYGWFSGWPVHNIYQEALKAYGYSYTLWRIEHTDFNDTREQADGSTGFGIPSAATLSSYDVVIWIHSGCPGFWCFGGGSPQDIGADDELESYLDAGGRLIISGQDIGYWDDGEPFYDNYLYADMTLDTAAGEEDTVTGLGFLDGLNLEITNASLYGYRNGVIGLWPDAVTVEDGRGDAYPILTYDNGNGTAALAVSPCDAPHRAVYFALGYENLGPRSDNRDPAFAEVMQRSLEWLRASKPAVRINLISEQRQKVAPPGKSVRYEMTLINSGSTHVQVDLSATGNQWPMQLFVNPIDGDEYEIFVPEGQGPLSIAPCEQRRLTAIIDIPATASNGSQDRITFTATPNGASELAQNIQFTTSAFTPWKAEKAMLESRYRLGAVALPNTPYLYAIGGWNNRGASEFFESYTSYANHRYNTCTQEWEAMSSLPESLANLAVATLDGQIYVAGGSRLDYYDYELVNSQSLYIYDPETDSWITGPSLPMGLSGASMAAVNGKLYLFGGWNGTRYIDSTYEYNPETGIWRTRAVMPGGERGYTSAATLNGKIYVVGGWPNLKTVEVYDAATNSWTTAAEPNFGRQSAGLTAGPDGHLYLSGGGNRWAGINKAERYEAATDTWTPISPLNDSNRAGAASVYATGRIFAIGGAGSFRDLESLRIGDAFCLSEISTRFSGIQPGERITYTVELLSDGELLPHVLFTDPVPTRTVFAGFGDNRVGATYNAAQNQVEWNGALAANADPVIFTFSVALAEIDWAEGDTVTNTARFEVIPPEVIPSELNAISGKIVFSRTVLSKIAFPDFSASSLTVDQPMAITDETLTYQVNLKSRSFAGGTVHMADPLPSGLEYIPNSLRYDTGTGRYNEATRSLHWSGQVLPGEDAFINSGNDYEWGDSKELGFVPNVTFEWTDIGESGTNATQGDDIYLCDLPIGFDFDYYGVEQSTFCVSTNGFISFDPYGYHDRRNRCPLPGQTYYGNDSVIAGIWDDLVVENGVYYQTFGTAPHRYLVVQWTDVRPYFSFSSEVGTFQIILYESGLIKVQILETGSLDGQYSTTGIENYTGDKGLTYACYSDGSLEDDLAVLFVPPGEGVGSASAEVEFEVRVTDAFGANTVVTNTVEINTDQGMLERKATSLLNPIHLGESSVKLDQAQVNVGSSVVHHFYLQNTGLMTAANASFVHALPESIVYLANSLHCGHGFCQAQGNRISWEGEIGPSETVTLTFEAQLTAPLSDRTSVTSIAQLDDGHGNLYEIEVHFLARNADLSPSLIKMTPAYAEPGEQVVYELLVHNSGSLEAPADAQFVLPTELGYEADSLTCGTGSCTHEAGMIKWTGTVPPRGLVMIRFMATVPGSVPYGKSYTNQGMVMEPIRNMEHPLAATLTIAHNTNLPLMFTIPNHEMELYLPVIRR